jgi:hypothetical protein
MAFSITQKINKEQVVLTESDNSVARLKYEDLTQNHL